MARKKESKWQPADTHPTEDGVYKVRNKEDGVSRWCYWHHKWDCWDIHQASLNEAKEDKADPYCSMHQRWEWKGVLG